MNSRELNSVILSRRTFFFSSCILITGLGWALFLRCQSGLPSFWPDYMARILFPILFSQLALGFVVALWGFFDWLRGGDPYHIMKRSNLDAPRALSLAATAIVIPVFNEDVDRVSRRITNMWRSLEKTGEIEHFDFYLCSDSNDVNHWIEEECCWLQLCQRLQAFGKLFYRKRHHAINGKSGNVADFCRRWGKNYRYMILLDADSIMSGATMVRMVRTMESNVSLGILQTQPAMVLGRSLFRRLLQFSSSVYGRLFSEGASVALMSSASYWGHNAIIRIAPFMEYCALPSIPTAEGKGHILSHDTIEAILMQRAGFEVWIAYDETGSYEEGPPNLSDMLKRDRRWCAGNLQHFWFLWVKGLSASNRLSIWLGLMSYLSSPIWLLFLVTSCLAAISRQRFLTLSAGPEDMGSIHQSELFILSLLTLLLLFFPRILGVLSCLRRAPEYGGLFSLLASAMAETLSSILLAPILMLFHTLFIFQIVLGWKASWTTQNREDLPLPWWHCWSLYGWQTALGLLSGTLGFHYLGATAWWLTPIFIPWILAPLIARMTSLQKFGGLWKQERWFRIPEESVPPPELFQISEEYNPPRKQSPLWTQALFSSYFLGLHLSLVRQKNPPSSEDRGFTSILEIGERLVREGPAKVTEGEKLRIVWDADALLWLHRELWSRQDVERHHSWKQSQTDCGGTHSFYRYFACE